VRTIIQMPITWRPQGTATGEDGGYRPFNVPAGTRTLLVKHPGGRPEVSREITMRPAGAQVGLVLR
jgi:hypothetical protein